NTAKALFFRQYCAQFAGGAVGRSRLSAKRQRIDACSIFHVMSLPDRFDPSAESKLYERWLDAGCFRADAERSKRVGGDREPVTIVMPPPNVTAALHLGHALDEVPQDVLIRWARMKEQEALRSEEH